MWEESWEGKKSMERETRKEGKKDGVETFWVRWEPTLSLEPRGTRGVKRKMERPKKKKGETPLPPHHPPPSLLQQKEYLCWEAGCVGTTSQILRINDQLAQSSAQCCCSANILDRRNKDWQLINNLLSTKQSRREQKEHQHRHDNRSYNQKNLSHNKSGRDIIWMKGSTFTFTAVKKYSTHNRRYVFETFEKGPNGHEKPQHLSKRRANLGNYSSQSGNNLRDMLMMETVQKVKCWILNETTKWNWLNLSSSGIWEPGLIPYMKCDLFTCMKPSSWMCMTKSNNSQAAIW